MAYIIPQMDYGKLQWFNKRTHGWDYWKQRVTGKLFKLFIIHSINLRWVDVNGKGLRNKYFNNLGHLYPDRTKKLNEECREFRDLVV